VARTHKQKWVLGLASVASLMVALDVTVVATALSAIRVDLRASIEQLEWTVNAYGLSFAVLLMTGAALGDRFGRRRLFAIGLAIFTGGSALAALGGREGLAQQRERERGDDRGADALEPAGGVQRADRRRHRGRGARAGRRR